MYFCVHYQKKVWPILSAHGWRYKNSRDVLRTWDWVAPNGDPLGTPEAMQEVCDAMHRIQEDIRSKGWMPGDPWCLHPDIKPFILPVSSSSSSSDVKLLSEQGLGRLFDKIFKTLKEEGWSYKKGSELVDWVYCPPGEDTFATKEDCMKMILEGGGGRRDCGGVDDWLHGKSISTNLFGGMADRSDDAMSPAFEASLASLLDTIEVKLCLPSSISARDHREVLQAFERIIPLLSAHKWSIFEDDERGIKYTCSLRSAQDSEPISDKQCIAYLVALKQQAERNEESAALSRSLAEATRRLGAAADAKGQAAATTATNKRKRVPRKSWEEDRLASGYRYSSHPVEEEDDASSYGDVEDPLRIRIRKVELRPWEKGDNLVMHPEIAFWLPTPDDANPTSDDVLKWSFNKIWTVLKDHDWKYKKGRGLDPWIYSPNGVDFDTPLAWMKVFMHDSKDIGQGYVTEPYVRSPKLHPMIASHTPNRLNPKALNPKA